MRKLLCYRDFRIYQFLFSPFLLRNRLLIRKKDDLSLFGRDKMNHTVKNFFFFTHQTFQKTRKNSNFHTHFHFSIFG